MPADDKGDFATPRVDKAGPAAVNSDVLTVSRKETDGGVIERLTRTLQNCRRVERIRKEYQATEKRAECTEIYLSRSTKQVEFVLKGNVDRVNQGGSYSCGEQRASMVGHLGAD